MGQFHCPKCETLQPSQRNGTCSCDCTTCMWTTREILSIELEQKTEELAKEKRHNKNLHDAVGRASSEATKHDMARMLTERTLNATTARSNIAWDALEHIEADGRSQGMTWVLERIVLAREDLTGIGQLRERTRSELVAERARTDAFLAGIVLPRCTHDNCGTYAFWHYEYGGVYYRCDKHKKSGFEGFSEPYELGHAVALRAILAARESQR